MRASEITVEVAKSYFGIDDDSRDTLVEMSLDAARAYVVSYTGRTASELDEMPDIAMSVLIIANEFFSNRDYTGTVTAVNPQVLQTLGSKSCNLLG